MSLLADPEGQQLSGYTAQIHAPTQINALPPTDTAAPSLVCRGGGVGEGGVSVNNYQELKCRIFLLISTFPSKQKLPFSVQTGARREVAPEIRLMSAGYG